MKPIEYFHAHLYADSASNNEALELLKKVETEFGFDIGRFWDRPIGPHPVPSCQITVPTESFGEFISWLMQYRGSLDFFVHPSTGDDWIDHTQHVMWLGKSYDLNTEMFNKSRSD